MKLIITAMENEFVNHFPNLIKISEEPFHLYSVAINNEPALVIISEIGKTNASSALTYALTVYGQTISEVVNIGYAGAYKLKQGHIYEVGKVYDNDFDLTHFGYELNQMPGFDSRFLTTANYEGLILYTADQFQTNKIVNEPHLVDMEGVSILRVAKRFKVKCRIFKLVTDLLEKDDQLSTYKVNEPNYGILIKEFVSSYLKWYNRYVSFLVVKINKKLWKTTLLRNNVDLFLFLDIIILAFTVARWRSG